jgi:hypothetical protein
VGWRYLDTWASQLIYATGDMNYRIMALHVSIDGGYCQSAGLHYGHNCSTIINMDSFRILFILLYPYGCVCVFRRNSHGLTDVDEAVHFRSSSR